MNAFELSNMLNSILIFIGSIFGALNLHQYYKYRKIIRECQRLETENNDLKLKLLICNDNDAAK